jgi:hypothetical protein
MTPVDGTVGDDDHVRPFRQWTEAAETLAQLQEIPVEGHDNRQAQITVFHRVPEQNAGVAASAQGIVVELSA